MRRINESGRIKKRLREDYVSSQVQSLLDISHPSDPYGLGDDIANIIVDLGFELWDVDDENKRRRDENMESLVDFWESTIKHLKSFIKLYR